MGNIMTFVGGAAVGFILPIIAGLFIDSQFCSNTDMSSVPDNEGDINKSEKSEV